MENELKYQKLPHLLRGEVTVGPRAVPIAVNGLGVECDDHSEVLGDPLEDVPRHPEVVPHLNPLARTNLELPLCGHYLEMKQASLIMHH